MGDFFIQQVIDFKLDQLKRIISEENDVFGESGVVTAIARKTKIIAENFNRPLSLTSKHSHKSTFHLLKTRATSAPSFKLTSSEPQVAPLSANGGLESCQKWWLLKMMEIS